MKKEIHYTDIWTDSRKITKGSLFVCLRGEKSDGHDYIPNVIKKGVSEILCSQKPTAEILQDAQKKNITITVTAEKNIQEKLVELLKKQYPINRKTKIIAVTGTDGKSSTVHFCREIAGRCGIPAASIGTLGAFVTIDGKTKKFSGTSLTTPDITTMFQTIQKLEQQGVYHIFVEYSSIGIHQGRLSGIPIHGAIFTTFGEDHLIYHKTLQEYRKQKNRLFTEIVDESGFALVHEKVAHHKLIKHRAKKVTLLKNPEITHTKSGIHFIINETEIVTKFFAEYLIENLNTAIIACTHLGIPLKKILTVIPKISGPKGRFEVITKSKKPLVIIDYAHTPEGLENLLTEIQKVKQRITKHNIIIVIGAGGNRDTTKRPLFGKISSDYGDIIIVTDDNPRNENPKLIREQIIAGISKTFTGKLHEIGNRENAIQRALRNASEHDIVVIVGKGHETYQIIGDTRFPFSDGGVVRKYL